VWHGCPLAKAVTSVSAVFAYDREILSLSFVSVKAFRQEFIFRSIVCSTALSPPIPK
jgi:hypothetical protein